MNKLISLFTISILACFFSFSANAGKVTLKFHTFVPAPANSNKLFVLPWSEKVKKESNGEIVTEMYYSMQLGGKPPQLVDQVREGVVDIVWTVAGYTPGRFPRLEAFELPFLPTKSIITSQAAQEYVETIAADDLKDYKILTVHVHSPGMIHTKNKLIKSMDDFKGLKMRGPTRVITGMLKSLGATPVGMPVPKVAPSLSKGVIELAENGNELALSIIQEATTLAAEYIKLLAFDLKINSSEQTIFLGSLTKSIIFLVWPFIYLILLLFIWFFLDPDE